MTLSIVLAAMFLLVLVNNMNETPMCGDCGLLEEEGLKEP